MNCVSLYPCPSTTGTAGTRQATKLGQKQGAARRPAALGDMLCLCGGDGGGELKGKGENSSVILYKVELENIKHY